MNQLTDRLRRRTVRAAAARELPANPLAAQPPGTRARVVGLREATSPLARRLCDLGFTPGTEVEVLRRAPLGDPVVYRLRDYEICLRARQAGIIEVEELP
jgi:ferrous iron transport protein A